MMNRTITRLRVTPTILFLRTIIFFTKIAGYIKNAGQTLRLKPLFIHFTFK
jgi:hypothetical protein